MFIVKVKYIGENDSATFINVNILNLVSIEEVWCRIVDETGEEYLYLSDKFKTLIYE
ncbi:hypothetical protein [Haloimpatiens massiliensis]|uniref:hypothetical protein n=1 Tax=Haloimpatiens massiliensis TaxID=1658110 RepID=UPI0015E07FF0|nr:hypothetical protein [Haloimpatiens massiliensis]